MVRADDRAVYHGHQRGVTAYAPDGSGELWHTATKGSVLFGWQEEDAVYAGTGHRVVQRLSKTTGAIEATYACDSAVYSCATSPGGRFVFAGDAASSVYCFDQDGTRLWKLGTGGGSALSMQYRDERLYLVTTDGSLVCVDASETAIAAAQQGTVPVARDVKPAAALPAYAPATAATAVATVAQAPAGAVVVECVQEGGLPGCMWCPRATTPPGTSSSRARYASRAPGTSWTPCTPRRAVSTASAATSAACSDSPGRPTRPGLRAAPPPRQRRPRRLL